MTISPDARLLYAAIAWTVAALCVVAVPFLWPALAAALAGVIALATWDVVLLRRLRDVRATRQLPPRASVGRAVAVRIAVECDDPVAVDIVDEVPSDLLNPEPVFTRVDVVPGTPVVLQYEARPRARGDREFGPLLMQMRSPLGFWRRRIVAGRGEVLRVYPDATRLLRPEALDPRRVFAAIGVRPTARRGAGMEFESLRDYVFGDDPRRVDWAASARRGRLVSRLYQHERNHTVLIVVDSSRLMAGTVGARTKLDYAIDAALALAYAAMVSGDRVGMMVFDGQVRGSLAPRAHRRELGVFMDLLRPIQPRLVEADYRALVRDLAVRQRHRALVVMLTDFVEVDAAMLTEPLTVLARRHRVLLVALRDRLYNALDVVAPGAEGAVYGPRSPVPGSRLKISGFQSPVAKPGTGDREPGTKVTGTVDRGPGTDLYRRLVLNDLLIERETALGVLRQRGLQTLDLPPEQVTAAVLNRYLALRYGPER